MVFSAISRVSLFEVDDDTDGLVNTGQEKKRDYNVSLHPVDAVQSRMKMEHENRTAKLIYPN